MKKLLTNAFVALTIIASNAQEINFVEFDLDNGLHVIPVSYTHLRAHET